MEKEENEEEKERSSLAGLLNSVIVEIRLRVSLRFLYSYSSCVLLPWIHKLIFINIAFIMVSYKMAIYYTESIFTT